MTKTDARGHEATPPRQRTRPFVTHNPEHTALVLVHAATRVLEAEELLTRTGLVWFHPHLHRPYLP